MHAGHYLETDVYVIHNAIKELTVGAGDTDRGAEDAGTGLPPKDNGGYHHSCEYGGAVA